MNSIVNMEKEKIPLNNDNITKNILLPISSNDWFETINMDINKIRPLIGINTIDCTFKGNHDIRANIPQGSPLAKAPCPKFIISPWFQSSYEPDYNINNTKVEKENK